MHAAAASKTTSWRTPATSRYVLPAGALGCAAGGHTFINNRIYILALERNGEDVNLHSFAPFLGADGDRVLYKKRLPGGPTGLIEG